MSVSRPPLRWHGGKWLLAPWIMSHFPEHACYVEAFGGGGSVLLRKARATLDVYNDLDGAAVTLFRLLRDDPDELIRRVELTPFSRADFNRAQDFSVAPIDDVDLCIRLLVRSHMGFGGASTCVERKTGFRGRDGTTPPDTWRRFPPVLHDVAERLQGVVIERRPAIDVIAMHDAPETLFYLDPPYLPEVRDAGADYTHEMSPADHDALLRVLLDVKGRVVLSGYASPRYDAALVGWWRHERPTFADGARPRLEVLWTNFDPAETASQGVLFASMEGTE